MFHLILKWNGLNVFDTAQLTLFGELGHWIILFYCIFKNVAKRQTPFPQWELYLFTPAKGVHQVVFLKRHEWAAHEKECEVVNINFACEKPACQFQDVTIKLHSLFQFLIITAQPNFHLTYANTWTLELQRV